MADAFLGEIRIFAGVYAPQGWAFCNGASVTISGNEALYSLLGTSWGGDGRTNFKLPDMRSRLTISMGQGTGLPMYPFGSYGGVESVALTTDNIPAHTHTFLASNVEGTTQVFASGVTYAKGSGTTVNYGKPGGTVAPFAEQTITLSTQLGDVHENRMPMMALNFIICMNGLYPSAN